MGAIPFCTIGLDSFVSLSTQGSHMVVTEYRKSLWEFAVWIIVRANINYMVCSQNMKKASRVILARIYIFILNYLNSKYINQIYSQHDR